MAESTPAPRSPSSLSVSFRTKEHKLPDFLLGIEYHTFDDALAFLSESDNPSATNFQSRIEALAAAIREGCTYIDEGLWEVSQLVELAFKDHFGQAHLLAYAERVLHFYEDFLAYHRSAKIESKAWQTQIDLCMQMLSGMMSDYRAEVNLRPVRGKVPLRDRQTVANSHAHARRSIMFAIHCARISLDLTTKNGRISRRANQEHLSFDAGLSSLLRAKLVAILNDALFFEDSVSLPAWDEFQSFCDFIHSIQLRPGGTSSAGPARNGRTPDDPHGMLAQISRECDPSRIAFNNINDLRIWWEDGWHFIHDVIASTQDDEALLDGWEDGPGQLLVLLLVQIVKMRLQDHLALVGRLFLLHFRRAHERCPNHVNTMNLIHALGAFSIAVKSGIFLEAKALRCIDEAIDLAQRLSAPHEVSRAHALASLYYARALVLRGVHPFTEEPFLVTERRALKGALTAVTMARAARNLDGSNSKAEAQLARALATAAHFGKKVLSHTRCLHLAHYSCFPKHDRIRISSLDKLNDTDPRTPSRACTEVKNSERVELAHMLSCDYSLGDLETFSGLAVEAAQLFRRSDLYEASLFDAICVVIRLLDSHEKEAFPYLIEALRISNRRLENFPDVAQEERERIVVYSGLGLLQTDSPLKTADTLRQSISGLQSLESDFPRATMPRLVSLRASLVLALAHLEQYDEAIEAAEAISLQVLSEEHVAPTRVKVSAIIAYCRWLKSDAQAALQMLAKALKEGTGYDALHPDAEYPTFRDATHLLMLGWLGAVKASLGRVEEAARDGKAAVVQMRQLLQDLDDDRARTKALGEPNDIWSLSRTALDPVDSVLPQLCFLLAATLAQQGGRGEEAAAALDETLFAIDDPGEVDPSTTKTALLLRAKLLEEDGDMVEALALRTRADAIPLHGFFHRLGCSAR